MKCKTILVIEDDDDIRNMLILALQVEGFEVVGAPNGKDGMALLAKLSGPCLILLDLMMPVMNGWEFLRAKGHDDVLATIPVVILSAFVDQARDEQVEGFLKKPIDLDALLKFVVQYCESGNDRLEAVEREI